MRLADPYVSVVLTGRNDNFGGDFSERLFRAVGFNRARLLEAGVRHEFVFVEWAPVAGRPHLAELLAERFPDEPGSAVSGYVADRRYHEAYTQNPRLRFLEFVAKNVGIRRAQGAYVLVSNTDIYYSRGVVEALAVRRLEAGTLYRAARVDLKLGTDLTHIEWSLLEDRRNHGQVNEITAPLYTNASGDFQLLDRESYRCLRGFNEVYRVAKIHVDSNFCMKAHSNGYRLVDIGAPVYHLNHVGSYNVTSGLYQDRLNEAPWGHSGWNWQVTYENPEGWGLGRAPERQLGERLTYLEYAPEAAPPLLDLRRVLLPAARGDAGQASC